jgi:hypothetical protein
LRYWAEKLEQARQDKLKAEMEDKIANIDELEDENRWKGWYEPGLFTLFGKLLTQFRRGFLREGMHEMYSIS